MKQINAKFLSDDELVKEFCERFELEYDRDSTGCILISDDVICGDQCNEPVSSGRWVLITKGITTGIKKGDI